MATADPSTLNWAEMTLPDTWADRISLLRPDHWLRLWGCIAPKGRKIELPDDMPGRRNIPKYLLQEFHNLPNGNYSKRFSRGYVTGFDHTMLGTVQAGRKRIARKLERCRSVLDVGCGGGRTAAQLKQAGIGEVWGLDPSPYLLQHAARDHAGIHFVQGVVENTHFANERFDGGAACFLFHELPPRYMEQALKELNRVLRPGGFLAICEPSPTQLDFSLAALFRTHGWKGLYFGLLARQVHEPFVRAWHRNSTAEMFRHYGFDVIDNVAGMPLRHLLLRKIAPPSPERYL